MALLAAGGGIDEIAAYVFLDIAVIVIVARLMGALFKRLRQPAVVGEIVAGILLGPTLLGAFPGDPSSLLFPEEVRPYLSVIAQLGLVIFMFIVGLELDLRLIRGKERDAAAISLSSVALPFALGIGLAALLHGGHGVVDGTQVGFLPFALFIGASMSVTAFPVLARILNERGMQRTPVGALALASAAVDDILAWSLLAVVLAVVAATGLGGVPIILLESLIFVAVMFGIVRPLLARLGQRVAKAGRLTPDALAIVLVGLLVSSFVTSQIGIHSIFGAFAFGAVMPRGDERLTHAILERVESLTVLLLLPVFFIATGLDVNIRGIDAGGLVELAAILAVACVGKFVGASLAARAVGTPLRQSMAVGTLMNTRGLTELVILGVGRQFGVLDVELFTLLVVMAVATTVMAEPLLRLIYPDEAVRRDVAEAERAAARVAGAYTVQVVVDDVEAAAPAVELATDLLAAEPSSRLVLTRLAPSGGLVGAELGTGLAGRLVAMADAAKGLEALAAGAEARGVPTVVLSRFSDDAPKELAEQAENAEADLVLAVAPEAGDEAAWTRLRALDAALRPVSADFGIFRPGVAMPDGPVVAVVGDDAGSGAGIEAAVRAARGRSAPLFPRSDGARRSARRAEAVAEAAPRLGVTATTDEAGGPALVVSGAAPDLSAPAAAATVAPLLLLRSRPTVNRDRLDALRERIDATATRTPSASPDPEPSPTELTTAGGTS